MSKKLSHLDEKGKPRMVDVSAKPDTEREAVATGLVRMKAATLKLLQEGGLSKGDALVTAQLAGIMAAKQTPALIPLCHPVLLGDVQVELVPRPEENAIAITARAKSLGKTGVEMEALTAVAVSALTIYDMCKAVDRGMRIEAVRLLRKSGGKSGTIVFE
ncbi:MAG: cyclic pyranopterin monophosphate synthase MoaC [Chloroflexota bacterium]